MVMRKILLTTIIISILILILIISKSGQEAKTENSSVPIYTDITTQKLYQMMQDKNSTLINVHIPYAGEIPQTDLFIPYNAIEQNKDKLPVDKKANLVVYCVSGRMSTVAANLLAEMGYFNVFNFKGGMITWEDAGYELLYRRP